ncbi:MAG: cytochrome P450 [Chloroflexota bacterium]|nr:cytochrome P450 [Chloroflexota bacterium]
MRRDPLHFFMTLARDYGDIAGFRLGPERVVLLNHPDHIKAVLVTDAWNFLKGRGLERAKRLLGEGLLTSEGEFHRRQRRLAQPAFHRQRVATYGTVMTRFGERARERWRDGDTLDVHAEMMALTLEIVGRTLFDADVGPEAAEIGQALTATMELFDTAMLPFAELLDRLPLPWDRRFERARARLDATIYRLIDERRASGDDRGDLLSMLLLAQDVEGDGGRMTDRQLRDEALTIFLAGHETTADALTWTWYLLSQHPDVEAMLHAEVDTVLRNRLPTADDLAQLHYTRQVLAESMRLYPPAWLLGRRALAEYRIGGYMLPARTLVLLSQYVTHHDARFFPEPFTFDPGRWTPEAQAARPRFSYFPFSAGPRGCIGEQFAWMEGILLLATIAQRWRFRLARGHPITLHPSVTLRPAHGMWMTVHSPLPAQRAGHCCPNALHSA